MRRFRLADSLVGIDLGLGASGRTRDRGCQKSLATEVREVTAHRGIAGGPWVYGVHWRSRRHLVATGFVGLERHGRGRAVSAAKSVIAMRARMPLAVVDLVDRRMMGSSTGCAHHALDISSGAGGSLEVRGGGVRRRFNGSAMRHWS